MKKTFSYFITLFFAAVYITGSNSFLMEKADGEKYISNSIFSSDSYRYGDLYGMSYLPEFKIPPGYFPAAIDSCKEPKKINLYMICDSYLWSFIKTDSIFCGVNKLKYARWSYSEEINEQLDTARKNVLIIEISERNIRQYLYDTIELYTLLNLHKSGGQPDYNPNKSTVWDKIIYRLFKPYKSQNLETNVFDFKFLTPVKELKAALNYRVFGRTDIDVSVSADKNYLFYSMTTDTALITSSFNPVTDDEISLLISNINAAYSHFKSLGFDNVYLSIIPEKVTVIEPGFGKYNELIPRIQNSGGLKTPLINIYNVFKNTKYPIYYRSDSHWNPAGFQLWVDETNKMLKKESGY